jgi:hypothetical protein
MTKAKGIIVDTNNNIIMKAKAMVRNVLYTI